MGDSSPQEYRQAPFSMELTKPQSPHFRVEERIKARKPTESAFPENEDEQHHQREERREERFSFSLTKPQSPHFRVKERAALRPKQKQEEEEEERERREEEEQVNDLNSLTQPKTPKFLTQQRIQLKQERREKPLSYEERVEMEMKSAPKFKARPVPKEVYSSSASGGSAGVPLLPKQALTVPLLPSFSTSSRPKRRRSPSPTPSSSSSHAKSSSPKKQKEETRPTETSTSTCSLQLTVPLTPNLLTEKRPKKSEMEKKGEEDKKKRVFQARPIPNYEQLVRVPQVEKPCLTDPSPFPLKTEERGQISKENLENRLLQERAEKEKKKIFQARPIPDYEQLVRVPQVEKPCLTDPSPFPLKTEERGQLAAKIFQEQLSLQMEKEKKLFSSFVARPFVVEESKLPSVEKLPLTSFESISLHSSQRALLRENFEESQRRKREEAERLEEERRREQAKREAEEIKQLRKRLVHVPCPILPPDPVILRRSAQPLTVPSSPQFKTKLRSGNRDL